MIQDVKLGTHRIGTYILICMPSVSVRSCSAFVWKISSKNLHFFRRKSSKINNVGVERCGHKKCSNSVAYDESHCDKFWRLH